jgi:hypothetical protein
VTSSREDMIARELEAQFLLGREFIRCSWSWWDRVVILESLSISCCYAHRGPSKQKQKARLGSVKLLLDAAYALA